MNPRMTILKHFLIDGHNRTHFEIGFDIWQQFPTIIETSLVVPFFEEVKSMVLSELSGRPDGSEWEASNDWDPAEPKISGYRYLCFYKPGWCWNETHESAFSITIGCNTNLSGVHCSIDRDEKVRELPRSDDRIREVLERIVKRKTNVSLYSVCWEALPKPNRNLLDLKLLLRLMDESTRRGVVREFVDYILPYFHPEICEAIEQAASARRGADSRGKK